jgi:hypothetical protein
MVNSDFVYLIEKLLDLQRCIPALETDAVPAPIIISCFFYLIIIEAVNGDKQLLTMLILMSRSRTALRLFSNTVSGPRAKF